MRQGKILSLAGSLLLTCSVFVSAGDKPSRSVLTFDQSRHFVEGVTVDPVYIGDWWGQGNMLCGSCQVQPCTVKRVTGALIYCTEWQARAIYYGNAISLSPGIGGVILPNGRYYGLPPELED